MTITDYDVRANNQLAGLPLAEDDVIQTTIHPHISILIFST